MSTREHRKLSSPVVIIGGGIMGCAAAYYLAKMGIQATLLEKATVAWAASGRSAGGVRAQCRDPRERAIAMASVRLWEGLEAELGIPVDYRQDGNLRLASNPDRLMQLHEEAGEELADGLQVEMWDVETLRHNAPYLAPSFVGAKYCPTDGIADPTRTTTAFAWAAQQRGATIITNTEVQEITTQDGQITGVLAQQPYGTLEIETPLVLHAGGVWSGALAAQLDLQVPLRPIRLAIGATAPVPPLFRTFLSAHDLGIAARPIASGQILVSGFGDPNSTFDAAVTPEAFADLHVVDQMVPELANVPIVHAWSGLLNVTPDEAPIIGSVAGLQGYLLATGFSGHGFCLGPIMGKLLAEWLVEGEPSMSLETFRLDRFTPAQLAWEDTGASSVIAGMLDR